MYILTLVLSCRSTARRRSLADKGNAFGAWRGNRPFLIAGRRSGAFIKPERLPRFNGMGTFKLACAVMNVAAGAVLLVPCYYISNVVRRVECLRALRSEFRQLVCSTALHRPRPSHTKTIFCAGGKRKEMST